jgi:hypothetical protein
VCFSFISVSYAEDYSTDNSLYNMNQVLHEQKKPLSESVSNGSELCLFDSNGKKITTKGLFVYAGDEYYGLADGHLKTGYQVINGHNLAYFDETTGKMVKDDMVGYLKMPEDGRLPYVYVEAYNVLNQYGWDLNTAFQYAYPTKYFHKTLRLSSSESYADYGFRRKAGNCYVKAAMFFVMGKLLGYDIHHMCGYVKGASPHSWTEVHANGDVYVCDPSFKNSYPELNGYMFKYKTKDTWIYTDIEEVYSMY